MTLERKRRAEKMVTNLRWMGLIGAALLLEDRAMATTFVIGAAFVFAYNMIGAIVCSMPDTYARTRPWLGHALRLCDIAVITMAVPVFSNDWGNFRLLYVPVVIGAGVVEGTAAALLLGTVAAGASAAIRGVVLPAGEWMYYDVAGNVLLFALAALFGGYLAKEGEREERNRLNIRRLAVFHDMGAALSNPSNVDHLAHLLGSVAVELTGIRRCVVMVHNPETDRHEVRAIRGYRSEEIGPDGLPEELRAEGGGRHTHDIPLVAQNKVLGSLRLIPEAGEKWAPDEELGFLATLATQAATAVRNASLAAEVQRRAETDALTGLANRWALAATAETEIERARRYGASLSVCICDFDDFKAVNDTYGHVAGDRVLAEGAAALKETIRPGDVAARFGGDEFLIMLINANPAQASAAAERFVSVIRSAVNSALGGDSKVEAGISMGVANYPDDAEDFDGLLRCADDRLLRAKRIGKGRIVAEAEPKAEPEAA